MSKIRIKNFGPIKEGYVENDGWLDIKKVTVFIGNQGSGKSTVAKLFSTFCWLEKALYRKDFDLKDLNPALLLDFINTLGIANYFTANSEINYIGDKFRIDFNRHGNKFNISPSNNGAYKTPKIMYVPAERVFFSVIKEAFNQKGLPTHLFDFAEELRTAQIKTDNKPVVLPFNRYSYRYDKNAEVSFVKRSDHPELNLNYASSGLQASIPLFLVTRYLTNLLENKKVQPREVMGVNQALRMNNEIASVTLDDSLSETEKKKRIKEVKSRYINKYLINIVEEPELNLFPSSQRQMLNSLLGYNNRIAANKLIITTHSPYIVNYLTLAIKAHFLKNKLYGESVYKRNSNKSKLSEIIPLSATVGSDNVAIYEMDEAKGLIRKLDTLNGIPSDNNYLNARLEETNELFAKLLKIQQSL